MAVLSASGLSAGYRDRMVLHDVNVAFGPGLHLVLGANGARKTTLADEPAWKCWRLHTLEVRMEHGIERGIPEAVPT